MPELFVTNMHRRHTGVSSTIERLVPIQARHYDLALVGQALPGCPAPLGATAAWRACRTAPQGRPFAIWHVRRNAEMRAALWARDVLRRPVRIVFTTTGTRRHSAFPRWLMSRMDGLIATTPGAAKDKPNVRAIVPHGVDCDTWRPAPDRAAAWAATGYPGRIGIATVGRVRSSKGTDRFVETMLRVLPSHPDATALVIGQARPKDAGFLAGLQARVREAGLSDRIVFTGEISQADLPGLLRACTLSVTLPRYEPFGLTPIESMASGVPFVGSMAGDFERVAADGEAGLVLPEADLVARAAETVGRLLDDPDGLRAMSDRARRAAVEVHSIEAEASGIAAVYDALWETG